MFSNNRIESTVQPSSFVDLHNGVWYYNYDITSETKQVPEDVENPDKLKDVTYYSYAQVRMYGKPTYSECVQLIIRTYISDTEELDLINSYNKYQMGESILQSKLDSYSEYLTLVNTIKNNVAKDFGITLETTPTVQAASNTSITTFAAIMVNTVELTDSQSLQLKVLFPKWEDYIGKEVKANFKLQYNNKLFKVVKDHTVQKQYPPSIDTASLYTEITETQSGTKDDPIDYPSDGNMVIYKGKYYKEDGVLYECIRDSGQPLYTKLANMIGNYVQKIS